MDGMKFNSVWSFAVAGCLAVARCLAVAAAIPMLAWAASPEKTSKSETPAKEVDLFAGMKSGEIEAVLVYKDSTQGTINIKNKSGQPLTVKIPEAFAGVPILAQRGGGGGGLGNAGGLGDRKSTRLNSSHSQSSYAVFCLKK